MPNILNKVINVIRGKPILLTNIGFLMLGLGWLKLFAVPANWMEVGAALVVLGTLIYLIQRRSMFKIW